MTIAIVLRLVDSFLQLRAALQLQGFERHKDASPLHPANRPLILPDRQAKPTRDSPLGCVALSLIPLQLQTRRACLEPDQSSLITHHESPVSWVSFAVTACPQDSHCSLRIAHCGRVDTNMAMPGVDHCPDCPVAGTHCHLAAVSPHNMWRCREGRGVGPVVIERRMPRARKAESSLSPPSSFPMTT